MITASSHVNLKTTLQDHIGEQVAAQFSNQISEGKWMRGESFP